MILFKLWSVLCTKLSNFICTRVVLFATGKIALNAWFRIEKKYNERGKPFVCVVTTPGRQVYVATNDEKIFHLFTFFMQVQIKLKDELEGLLFCQTEIDLAI